MVLREDNVAIGNPGVLYDRESDWRVSYESRHMVAAIMMLAIGMALMLAAALSFALLFR